MDIYYYLMIIGFSVATIIGFLLPFIVPTIVSFYKGTYFPRRKLFVFVCGVFSYGLGGLTAIVIAPIGILSTFLGPQLHNDGYVAIASILHNADSYLEIIALIAAVVIIFSVPIYARKGLWQRVCEALANQSIKADEI